MHLELERHQDEYVELGFTVIQLIPEEIAIGWGNDIVQAITAGFGQRVDQAGDEKDGLGGRLYYDLIDGIDCTRLIPGMLAVYQTLPALLSAITGLDVVCSPYDRSRVCGKRYPAGGGQQGYHFDTNGITVVVYLSTNSDGKTRMQPLTGAAEVMVQPQAGHVLLMQGRKVWHRSDPVAEAQKIISPWNYYENGDTWRPPGLDDAIYGKR